MIRVGLGYDIHRTSPQRRMVLGGVEIPAEFGLEGHSDADVILHALMDALLGACSLGDIGQHFPPSDSKYRGVSSLTLLRHAHGLITEAGYRVVNVDVVLVAEQPRIADYVGEMRSGISEILEVDLDCVGLKATTNEGVGPEGRGEALSAQAVALLERAP